LTNLGINPRSTSLEVKMLAITSQKDIQWSILIMEMAT